MELERWEKHPCAFFSRMRSEGFPFIVWWFGGWTLVRRQLVGASFSRSRRFRVVNLVSIGEAAKPRVFCCGDVQHLVAFAAETSPCLYRGSCNTSCLVYTVVLERACTRIVVYGSTGTRLCKHCLERVCASIVVYGSTGTCL